jgi:hypothetical protein
MEQTTPRETWWNAMAREKQCERTKEERQKNRKLDTNDPIKSESV